jgi:hypothetical protein
MTSSNAGSQEGSSQNTEPGGQERKRDVAPRQVMSKLECGHWPAHLLPGSPVQCEQVSRLSVADTSQHGAPIVDPRLAVNGRVAEARPREAHQCPRHSAWTLNSAHFRAWALAHHLDR